MGWAENTSCQGPEHAHIELIKNVAHLTNNKDVFLCILHYHCCRGFLQQYEQTLSDMLDVAEGPVTGQMAVESATIQKALQGDRNFSISCELGLCSRGKSCIFVYWYVQVYILSTYMVHHKYMYSIYMVHTITMSCFYQI